MITLIIHMILTNRGPMTFWCER